MRPTEIEFLHALEDDMLAHHQVFAGLPQSTIYWEDDCFCYSSRINFGAYGGVLRQRLTPSTADERIREVNAKLKSTGKDYGWVLSPVATPADLEERLVRQGCEKLVQLTGMVLDFRDLATAPEIPHIEVRKVQTEVDLEHYARIYPLLFHVPVEGWLEDLVQAELAIYREGRARWNRWLACEDGRPVAACRTGRKDGIAALQILCTLPEHRNRGIGRRLATRALLDEECDWGVVWSGPDADRMYSRMGFREICKTSVYV